MGVATCVLSLPIDRLQTETWHGQVSRCPLAGNLAASLTHHPKVDYRIHSQAKKKGQPQKEASPGAWMLT